VLARPNGWERIGTVLAGLWLFFIASVGLYSYVNLDSGKGAFVHTISGHEVVLKKSMPPQCLKIERDLNATRSAKEGMSLDEVLYGLPHGMRCSEKFEGTDDVTTTAPDQHEFQVSAMLFTAFVPLVLMWLVLTSVIAAIRWIAMGFQRR
jgi:hypothetical protein